MSLIYMETGSTDPHFNLAFEEYVLLHRRSGNYLLLWQNDNTIVIGQNQNTEEEINSKTVEELGINVVRRTTGGGAVYHDLGNLNYSFITDVEDAEKLTMEQFTVPVVTALKALGLDAEASGRNDITVSGKKVSGTAQRMHKDRILYHGTLLFDSDPRVIEAALRVDPEKFSSKSAKSVRSRVGNIRDMLPEGRRDMKIEDLKEHILREISAGSFERGSLDENELLEVERLRTDKYEKWEWNYGRSPAFSMKKKRRWDGGSLEVRAFVEKSGIISEIAFYGDYLSLRPADVIVEAIKGIRLKKDEIGAVLDKYQLKEYFGSITKEEILGTIFE